jgi:hypothetical protein
MLRLFGGPAVLQVWRFGDLRVGGRQCCGATGLGSGCPEISERQGQSGREGSSDNDCWTDRWGLRQWQFRLVAWVSERGWLGLEVGCQTGVGTFGRLLQKYANTDDAL